MSSTTAFVQQLLDNLYPNLNNPDSGDYYLPKLIQDKGYDPYGPFSWPVSFTSQSITEAASQICGDIQLANVVGDVRHILRI